MPKPEIPSLHGLYYIYLYHSKMMVSQPLFFKNHIDFSFSLILKVAEPQKDFHFDSNFQKMVPNHYLKHFPFKDKYPEVPFHRITSSYSYFEEFEFLRQFSKKQNMIKKKYQLNRNEKFADKAQQCFAFLHIKPKFKLAVQ